MNKVISGLVRAMVMKRSIALLVASLFILALALGACAGPTSVRTSAPAQAQEAVVAPAGAVFQVDGLSINRARVYPGQPVVIMAKVANKGNAEGEYIGNLGINDTFEEQKKVTLAGGTTQTLNFSTFKYEAGTYTVTLGGLTGQFEVLAEPPAQNGSGPAASSCCQQPNSNTTQPNSSTAGAGCCGGGGSSTSTPITPVPPGTSFKPTTQKSGGCCGG